MPGSVLICNPVELITSNKVIGFLKIALSAPKKIPFPPFPVSSPTYFKILTSIYRRLEKNNRSPNTNKENHPSKGCSRGLLPYFAIS